MKRLPFAFRLLAACLGSFLLFGSLAAAAESPEGERILRSLAEANDRLIEQALARPGAGGGGRGSGALIMTMAAAYANPLSKLHHDARLVPAMEQHADILQRTQNPSGLWNMGNIDSPPDSSFVLKTLAKGQLFLERDNHAATAALRAKLKNLILTCAEGVRTGGIHTPNHRWAVCTALAHVNLLYPDQKYIDRVDEWLAEGIDVDADGLWAERSSNYTSDVNNPSMVDLAILLKRPALLDPVRRSLDASLYFFEPNGEVETVASRRQDQRAGSRKHVWEYYYPYRYLAILDGNGTYAAVARWIEREFLEELGNAATNMSSPLSVMLEFPELTRALPPEKPLPAAYAKVFPLSSQARLKRGPYTATVFGGTDWYEGLGFGSGISTNPTFFKMRKGAAILESVRMAPSFFSTGFFFSQGLKQENGAYVLWQDLDVPYHLPLPKERRRADGQYPLQPDMGSQGVLARYFSRMAFAERPKHFVSLKSKVTVTEKDEGYELAFEIDGEPGVGVTIELGFRSSGEAGGTLAGVASGAGSDGLGAAGAARNRGGPAGADEVAGTYLLREGYATYTAGGDTITFGPGAYPRPPGRMEGETFTWIGGSMRAEGDRVYLTGVTPFKHTLTFK